MELDRAAAIARAIGLARPGDVVIIAGKGAEQGQEFADRTFRSTTARLRREALKAMLEEANLIPLPLAEVRELSLGDSRAADVVTGVQVDSRLVRPGDLFVAVSGGEAFLEDARGRGAGATLAPDDAHAALAALGSAVRARSDARIVAITGSVGKTSTKDILAAILRPHLRTVAAAEGFNNEIGLPLTLCRPSPRPRSSSRRWRCAEPARSATSRALRGRTSA